jgi:hypothetical protein
MSRMLFSLGLAVAALHPLSAEALPVRGLHLMAPAPDDVPLLVRFIEDALSREGVNTLVLEIGYRYRFPSDPELALEPALTRDHVRRIVEACRRAGVELIPSLNCLGHQSWAENTFPLLRKYPEFDETPGLHPSNEGIYCRSYCPRHPDLHEVLFGLIDDLVEAFEAKAFHVGMDEVFLLGEDACPRCRGRDKARLFADEVRKLYEHLRSKGVRMWMWGDRFLDGEATGIGKWEASLNETAGAVDLVPRDIVICDWHYEFSPPTAGYFAVKGFQVVMSPWRKSEVALAHLDQIRMIRRNANPDLADQALGVLHTTWTNPAAFIRAYYGEGPEPPESARESAECFKDLFRAIRKGD